MIAQRTALGSSLVAAVLAAFSSDVSSQQVESRLEIFTVFTGQRAEVYRAAVRFEAPNWSRDGKWLVFNQEGKLFAIASDGTGLPTPLDIGDLRACNNDHGLSPDGTLLVASCDGPGDQSAVYVLPFVPPVGSGAPRDSRATHSQTAIRPRLLTPKTPSYWHGWSPDGKTLAHVGQRNGEFDIYAIPVDGGGEQRLTTAPGLDDGPDYAPDGRWIYFNSERSGVMRIWRMRPDGRGQEMITRDAGYADWFPHPSPDGRWIVFLSYNSDVKGHPPDHDVVLRMMPADKGAPKVIVSLFGGQGTINVPSWSPDSQRFAFVSYRK
jgi:Tol biopolymer transport system component